MNLDPDQLKRVSALFDALHELSADQRAERLTVLTIAEPEVAAELSRWLQKDEESLGVLDAMTQGFAAGDAIAAESASSDRSGQRVGAYALLRQVGRGGMGEVYEARRPGSDFEQRVAVKLLRRGLDSDDIVRRFLRERRILAQLEHPGIARLIDGGVSEDGLPYLVMEFVEGRSLIEAANAASLDLTARLNLFLLICDAVAYAHRRLIVHRDLKPSNVLLTPDNQPKLLDFGIAKLIDDVDDEHLTGTGTRVMTPGYAAPEQILGQPISTATDVYALGLILYELLTGTSPHQRQGKDLERVIRDLDQESAIRPSSALLKAEASGHSTHSQRLRLARQLAGDIDTIVLHALKREPERRYQGAAELAEDIRRHINGHPVRAQTDTLNYRMRKFVRRHRGGVTAVGLAIVGIIAGLVIALWQAGIAREQAARADAETRRATLQATRADRVKDFVLALFQEQSPLTRDKARAATAGELIERGIAAAQSQFTADLDTQAEIIGELAQLQFGLGDIQQSVANLQTALALHEQSGGKASTEYAKTLSALGAAWLSLGETEQGTQATESSLAILRKSAGVDSIETADAERQMTRLLVRAGRPSEALPIAQHIYAVYKRERGALHSRTLQQLYNVGEVLSHAGRLKEAEQVQREVIAGYESSGQNDHAALVYPQLALARMLKETDQLSESATLFDSALASARAALDADHPMIGRILVQQGDLLRNLERMAEAEQAWQGAEKIFVKHGLAPELAGIAMYRGALALEQRRFDVAIAQYEKALAHYQDVVGADNAYSYSTALELAKARAVAGQTARAVDEGRAAYLGLKALAEPGSSDESLAHYAWAEVLFAANQLGEAEAQFRQALAVHSAVHGSDTVEAAAVQWKIAETLYAQNREVAESLALMEQALNTMRKSAASDTTVAGVLVLRGKLFDRAQQPEAAQRDWRAAHKILLAAFGADDRRVVELAKLLAR